MAEERGRRGRQSWVGRYLRSRRTWLVVGGVVLAVATARLASGIASSRILSQRIRPFVGDWSQVGGVNAAGRAWTLADQASYFGTGRAVDVVGAYPATMRVEADGRVRITPQRLRLRAGSPPLPYPDHWPVMRWSVDREGRLLNERWLRKHGHCMTGYLSSDGSQLRLVMDLPRTPSVTTVFERATATR